MVFGLQVPGQTVGLEVNLTELMGLGFLSGAMIAGFNIVFLAIWIYQGFAYMTIANRIKTPNGWLAFIPVANLVLFANMARMHWWPVLLLITPFVFIWIPILGWIISFLAILTLLVFNVIWLWKIFERAGRPGWWPLLMLIPFVGYLIYLILLGITAWGKK